MIFVGSRSLIQFVFHQKWAAARNKKGGNDLCAQRRLRSAWASDQSDQSLCCALIGKLSTHAFFMRTAKTLIRLGGLQWVISQGYSLFHHSDRFDFVFSLRCIDWVRKPLCKPNFLCIFCIRNYIWTQGERPLNPSVVYTTDRSKAVVLILSSSVVNTMRRFMFGHALLFFCVSSALVVFWSPCLEKRKLVFVLIVHLFVSYALVNLCHFFSSSWCRELAASSACGSSWTFLFTFSPGAQVIFFFLFCHAQTQIIREAAVFQYVSSGFRFRVIIGSLMRLYYVVWPIFFLMNVFIALKGTNFLFLFAFTAAGVVQCAAVKRLPLHIQ